MFSFVLFQIPVWKSKGINSLHIKTDSWENAHALPVKGAINYIPSAVALCALCHDPGFYCFISIETMPLCVSSCFSDFPCLCLLFFLFFLPHLSFSLLTNLTCSWSPRQCPCVYSLCSPCFPCLPVLVCLSCVATRNSPVSPHVLLWYVSGFSCSLICTSSFRLCLAFCYFGFCSFDTF